MRENARYIEENAATLDRDYDALPCSVHCFGYGTDANVALLSRVAEIGGGSYFFIEEEPSIFTAFGDCLGGLLSTVACVQSIGVRTRSPGVIAH